MMASADTSQKEQMTDVPSIAAYVRELGRRVKRYPPNSLDET